MAGVKFPARPRRLPKGRTRSWWVIVPELHGPSIYARCRTYHEAVVKVRKWFDNGTIVRVALWNKADPDDEAREHDMREARYRVKANLRAAMAPSNGPVVFRPPTIRPLQQIRDLEVGGWRKRAKAEYAKIEREVRSEIQKDQKERT